MDSPLQSRKCSASRMIAHEAHAHIECIYAQMLEDIHVGASFKRKTHSKTYVLETINKYEHKLL
jgi:hypothetical protein